MNWNISVYKIHIILLYERKGTGALETQAWEHRIGLGVWTIPRSNFGRLWASALTCLRTVSYEREIAPILRAPVLTGGFNAHRRWGSPPNRRSLNCTKCKTKAGDNDDFTQHLQTGTLQTPSSVPQKTWLRSTEAGVRVVKQGFGTRGCKKDGQRKRHVENCDVYARTVGEDTKTEYFQTVLGKNGFTSVVICWTIPRGGKSKCSSWYRLTAALEVYTSGQSDFIEFICNVGAGVLKFSLGFKS